MAELRNLAKDCDFATALSDNLRDRLVCGVGDPIIQKKLLAVQDLTFQKAYDIAESQESAAKSVVTLQGSATAVPNVHNIPSMTTNNSCYRCGRKGHQQSDCKFKSATCHHCGKVGHIKPDCKSLKSSSSHEICSNRRPRSFRPSDRSSQSFRQSDRLSQSFRRSSRSDQPSGLRQLQDVPTDRT